jgi:hypothetical protein
MTQIEPMLTAVPGETDTGSQEPRLLIVWLDPAVPTNHAVAFAFAVAARVTEVRPEDSQGWSIDIPNRPTRTDSTTTISLIARTWPRSSVEAAEALAVFAAVAAEADALSRELDELSGRRPL